MTDVFQNSSVSASASVSLLSSFSRHGVFYSSAIPEVTQYEPLYNTHTRHNFSSKKLHFWGRLRDVNPLPFALNFVVKDSFLTISSYNLEKRVFSLPWKKICRYRCRIFFILLPKSMKNLNAQLSQFSYIFKWRQTVDCDVLKSSANSWVILRRLHSTNFVKAYWSRSDGCPVFIF